MNKQDKIFNLCLKLQAMSQTGLAFVKDPFDQERYQSLQQISAELMALYTELSSSELEKIFKVEFGYATPKISVRSFILKDNQLLLVKERSNGLWALPGGWIDVGITPSETAIKETYEETGFHVKVMKLLALWDNKSQDVIKKWPHSVTCHFHCEIISGEPKINDEISAIDFFNLENLPSLSRDRITKKQIAKLHQLILQPGPTVFD